MKKVINVNEDTRVVIHDQYSWCIEKSNIIDNPEGKNHGKIGWYNHGYYSNVSQVIKALADIEIKDSIGDMTKISNIYEDIVAFGDKLLIELKK